MPNVLITGANRGIGIEFARQYVADGWRVRATCRDPSAADELNRLAEGSDGRVTLHALDVRDRAQTVALARELAGAPLDLLLNNAGVMGPRPQGLGEIDDQAWAEVLDINVMGPLRMAEAFVDNVAASDRKLIVTLSSRMGSMAENSGGHYIYRSSKAAVNSVVTSLAIDLAARGIIAICFHPGWVQTDMGGAGAAVTPADSVSGMRLVIEGLGAEDSGRFFNYDGGMVAW
jgi:NAD(P)-dependent dehydrogenase (short-subunit alcohol dehydrogenase family)